MQINTPNKKQPSGKKKPYISPREFARLWNLLLTKVRMVAKDANNFPATILTMDQNDEHVDDTLFVVERLSSDHEFIEEMTERTGSLVSLVVEKWGGITIQAVKQNNY